MFVVRKTTLHININTAIPIFAEYFNTHFHPYDPNLPDPPPPQQNVFDVKFAIYL